MALLTENKINQFGVQEEYWRILKINIDTQYNFCDITLGGYANQEVRDSESEPMNIRKVRANWSEEEFIQFFSVKSLEEAPEGSNIYKRAYEYVKYKDKYFEDAINC